MSNIIKQDKKKFISFKHVSRKKKVIIGIIIVLVFAGGIAAGWFFMQNKQVADTQKQLLAEELVIQTTQDAQTAARLGDTDGAAAKYDEVIKTSSDNYQKSILTINKSIIYLNEEDYDKALSIAKEAEAIDSNFAVVKIIAQIYEEKGDKQNAIDYYTKTIALINPEDPLASDDKVYYQGIIDSLNGVVKDEVNE